MNTLRDSLVKTDDKRGYNPRASRTGDSRNGALV